MNEPEIHVGILHNERILFRLHGDFLINGKESVKEGEYTVTLSGKDHIEWNGNLYPSLTFIPTENGCAFDLLAVTIGVDFHWERKETQRFQGCLRFITNQNEIIAINSILLEKYLTSVISSEMSATASAELLKAHAVISRSWLLAQLPRFSGKNIKTGNRNGYETGDEIIRWFDREDHSLFDVCADDHCQRYQGITRISTPQVEEAIRSTRGEVLMADNRICDARFSKCCGGISEKFENCWENEPHSYLAPVYDAPKKTDLPDLTAERNAVKFIHSCPDVFCNTQDPGILGQVLNGYDQETADFFRWKVIYTQRELSELVKKRSGIDFGTITDLIPLTRGASGRITRLKIAGTQKSMVVGKELIIRKFLSASHLYSSAFTVTRNGTDFRLDGAGWGHGAGLCQIGAAVMGAKGYTYRDILKHYYTGSCIKIIYP